MFCSDTKVHILVHQFEICIVVGKTHLKQSIETESYIAVLNGILLDAGNVDLFWSDKFLLFLRYQVRVRVLKLRADLGTR